MNIAASELLHTLRLSHETLAGIVENLDGPALEGLSYCSEWSIAEVVSHLGSGAEIFDLLVDAGLKGEEAPSQDQFVAIWDKWNARGDEEKALESIAANDQFLLRLEALSPEELDSIHLTVFHSERDASSLFRMRLFEHALHSWDIAVCLDPSATVLSEAVALLIDYLGPVVERSGKPTTEPLMLKVTTTEPTRDLALSLSGVTLNTWDGHKSDGELQLPAEALIRLVYGRLDPQHTPPLTIDAREIDLDGLRTVFSGF